MAPGCVGPNSGAGGGENTLQQIRQPTEQTDFAITGVMVLFCNPIAPAIGLYRDFIQTNVHANLRGSRISLGLAGLKGPYHPYTEVRRRYEIFVTNRS